MSVLEAPGTRPVRVAVGGGGQACDRRGAAVDAAGRDRLAHAAADLAAADGRIINLLPCNGLMQFQDS